VGMRNLQREGGWEEKTGSEYQMLTAYPIYRLDSSRKYKFMEFSPGNCSGELRSIESTLLQADRQPPNPGQRVRPAGHGIISINS
jgi:hypothetical protein